MAHQRDGHGQGRGQRPAGRVARQTLAQRIERVSMYLQLAAGGPEKDIEHVHQLRVATRRAIVAIDGFERWLPRRRARRIRAVLKRLRQAAGTARDLDVLIERIRRDGGGLSKRRRAKVLRRLRRRRRQAQKPIDRGDARWRSKRIQRPAALLVQRIRWRGSGPEPTLAAAAGDALRPQLKVFFQAARGDLSKIRGLHTLRIAGKHLRYTIELFTPVFDPAFREQVVPELEQLQDRLGTIIDLAVARTTLNPRRGAKDRVVSRTDLDRAQKKFHKWWTRKSARLVETRFRQLVSDGESSVDAKRASAS